VVSSRDGEKRDYTVFAHIVPGVAVCSLGQQHPGGLKIAIATSIMKRLVTVLIVDLGLRREEKDRQRIYTSKAELQYNPFMIAIKVALWHVTSAQ